MNWTSTKVPMWQLDCQNFWRAGSAFEVRDVASDEDKQFIEIFASSHNLTFTRFGNSALFSAPNFSTSSPVTPAPSQSSPSGSYA